jgi:hypothetical protein
MKNKIFIFFVAIVILSNKVGAQSWTVSGTHNYTTTSTYTASIGTTTLTSGYKFQVVGKIKASTSASSAYVDLVPETTTVNTSIEIGSGTTASQIDFKGTSHLGNDYWGRISYTDGAGFAFRGANNGSDQVVFKESGAVGIGITPGTNVKFHMYGGVSEMAKFEYNSSNFVQVYPLAGQIVLAGSASGFSPAITFIDDHDASASPDSWLQYFDATGLDIGSGGSLRMRIKADGKVIIGDPANLYSTSLSNYKLFVETGIITERIKIALKNDATNWSDYVFAPDYNLLSLDSVKLFTEQNCHLPGMPSADKVYAEGIDVADMDALLLKQIEELWLQMFLLKKENEELKKELLNK